MTPGSVYSPSIHSLMKPPKQGNAGQNHFCITPKSGSGNVTTPNLEKPNVESDHTSFKPPTPDPGSVKVGRTKIRSPVKS